MNSSSMPAAKNKTIRVVLDTSLFVNPDVRGKFGKTPAEALKEFVALARLLPDHEFYMPPSVFEELMNFVDKKEITGEHLIHLRQKAPSRYEMSIPALFFYELVEDMRQRVNKGLRIAESAVRSSCDSDLDDVIRNLRHKYRDALREGVVDSKEDVDMILLARELDALLISADKGAVKWADKLGIKWLMPEKFKEYLVALCETAAREDQGS